MLIVSPVTRIGVYDELSIRQVLRQDERVDRRNYDILIAVNDKRWMCDVLQRRITITWRYDPPFPDRVKLRHGRVPGHRKIPIPLARVEYSLPAA
jgi:hypothetical protein